MSIHVLANTRSKPNVGPKVTLKDKSDMKSDVTRLVDPISALLKNGSSEELMESLVLCGAPSPNSEMINEFFGGLSVKALSLLVDILVFKRDNHDIEITLNSFFDSYSIEKFIIAAYDNKLPETLKDKIVNLLADFGWKEGDYGKATQDAANQFQYARAYLGLMFSIIHDYQWSNR
jgi:hypothetical protein